MVRRRAAERAAGTFGPCPPSGPSRSLGARAHRAQWMRLHRGMDGLEPGLATLIDVALISFGAALGALLFSLVIGRRRAHQLARLADRLAQATDASAPPSRLQVSGSLVRTSLERLAGRIADVEALATTDQLTRLLNRQACLAALTRRGRAGQPVPPAPGGGADRHRPLQARQRHARPRRRRRGPAPRRLAAERQRARRRHRSAATAARSSCS